MDEQELVERAREGDPDAFGELVTSHHERIYALVYRYVGNEADADELEQRTWIRVWKKLRRFKGRSSFYTWVYRIAVYQCLDFLRHRKRLKESELDGTTERYAERQGRPVSLSAQPDRETVHGEIRERFYRALEDLTPEHRSVLLLREVEGLSYEEIAKILKCRTGTVMSRIYYARRAIQDELRDLL